MSDRGAPSRDPSSSGQQQGSSDLSQPGILLPVLVGSGLPVPDGPAIEPGQFAPDIERGWPPTLRNAQRTKSIQGLPEFSPFTDADRRRNLEIALRHPEVRDRLTGRWEALGCDRTYAPTRRGPSRGCVTVCLYNYTDNQMLNVYIQGGEVTSIANKEPWQHPATRLEMAQAINLARTHDDLREAVQDLDAHAILRVFLEPGHPCFRHRCIEVMFTGPDDPHVEQPTLFRAIVDLSTQSVVMSGPADCAEVSSQSQ